MPRVATSVVPSRSARIETPRLDSDTTWTGRAAKPSGTRTKTQLRSRCRTTEPGGTSHCATPFCSTRTLTPTARPGRTEPPLVEISAIAPPDCVWGSTVREMRITRPLAPRAGSVTSAPTRTSGKPRRRHLDADPERAQVRDREHRRGVLDALARGRMPLGHGSVDRRIQRQRRDQPPALPQLGDVGFAHADEA